VIETVAAALLIFARLSGLLMALPALGSGFVPGIARLGAAVPLTVLLLPVAGAPPVPETLGVLLGSVASEFVLGIAMGFAVYVAFVALTGAADLLAMQGGMYLATMLDPLTMSSPGPVGVLATWLGTGVFLGLGMHLHALAALADSFQAVPPGAIVTATSSAAVLIPAAGDAISAGVTLAGPLTIFVFTVNLGLSILTRMAPNLQLFFAIGPSVTIVASLALLGVALPALLTTWARSLPVSLDAIAALAELAR
jgi:flagellar biosynthetic protein FliR